MPVQAAKAGNLGACTAVANFLSTIGLQEEGMRYRRRAAKLGDAPSQVCVVIKAFLGKQQCADMQFSSII